MVPVYVSVFFSFYILGAFATTDILRLTKDSVVPVCDSHSYCPSCGHSLRLRDQIPILSYLFCRGRCRYCSAKIPAGNFILEILIFLLGSVISLSTHFQWNGYLFMMFFYVALKIGVIIILGKCTVHFRRNLLLSFLQNLVIFGLIAFFFLICQIA